MPVFTQVLYLLRKEIVKPYYVETVRMHLSKSPPNSSFALLLSDLLIYLNELCP